MNFWTAFPGFILLRFLCLTQRSEAATLSLSVGAVATPTPSPLSILPSQNWDGVDGPWSSFLLRVGSPPQSVRVLISTAGNQPFVVLPEGCLVSDPSDCPQKRGGIFSMNASSTWTRNNITTEGIFSLAIETNLGLSGNGLYGYDSVALGFPGGGTSSLDGQVVGGIATKAFYMGLFGLNPSATNFSTYNNPVQSYMSSLKSQNQIPSLSYGYTAGSQYRFNKVFGSLTLGGYDSSLFEPNNLTVQFSGQSNFDLTVNVNTITMSSNGGDRTLSSTSFPAFVDSTVPYLYLPVEVCQKFEEAFGITYDNNTDLYLVNDTLHDHLLAQSANVVLTLTNMTAEVMVDIALPYQAFDLIAEYPLIQNSSRYFPLKRAANNSQTTLGRTFLQEAYLIADYERSNFSIYQRKWDPNAQQSIQAILPAGATNVPPPHAPQSNIIPISIAASVGGSILITIVVGCTIIIRQRNKKIRALSIRGKHISYPIPTIEKSISPSLSPEPKGELDAVESQMPSPELDCGPLYFQSLGVVVSPTPDQIHEMPAIMEVVPSELGGSPVSEGMPWVHGRANQLERAMIREKQNERREQLIREDARLGPRRCIIVQDMNWI